MRKPWCAVVVLCCLLPALPPGNAVTVARMPPPPAWRAAPVLDAMLGALNRRPQLQTPVATPIGDPAARKFRGRRPLSSASIALAAAAAPCRFRTLHITA